MTRAANRYSTVAIALHWLIAALVLANIGLVYLTEGMTRADRTPYMDLHKAIGISVLALTLIRLGWRLGHTPPPLPAAIPAWQRRAATATHVLFYVLLLALPLSGWLWMSAIPAPMTWFGLADIPLWPVAGAEEFGAAMRWSHQTFGFSMIVLVGLHLLGAAKHMASGERAIIARMLPEVDVPARRRSTEFERSD